MPTQDARGRHFSEVQERTDRIGIRYFGRIGDLWGYVGVKDRTFSPGHPDDSAYADWSERFIDPRVGYWRDRKDDSSLVKGTWFTVKMESGTYYLFLPVRGGQREWAKSDQRTGNGPGSTILTLFANATLSEYPWPL